MRPLLIAQCVLLWLAGFAASPFLGGLAYRLCLISAFVVLPLFAIAVVTHNFARMTLTLLGVLIAALGLLLLGVWRRHTRFSFRLRIATLGWQPVRCWDCC